jgi:ribonuclease BN (tRNA processing enzyme)
VTSPSAAGRGELVPPGSMRLTVVGCSGSIPGPESPASCYLVQAAYEGRTFSLLLDLGSGALGVLHRYLDPSQVDAFALSHLHPDHCLDLCAYYVLARYSPNSRSSHQPVYAPPGADERISRAYDVGPPGGAEESEPTLRAQFRFHDWQPVQQIGPFVVRAVPVEHPVEAYAIRVTHDVPDGGSLVYSGDTGPCDALVELARDADLLLVEASTLDGPDNPPRLHLSGRQAAEIGARAGAGAVLLTHIPPWQDPDAVLAEALPHFDGPLSRAVTGASWEIG